MAALRVLGLGLFAVVTWGFGLTLLRALKLPKCGTAARGVLAVGLALAVDVFVTLLLGWCGFLRPWTAIALVGVEAAVGAVSVREMIAAVRLLPNVSGLLWIPPALGLLTLVLALAPPLGYDGPNEHYPLAKAAAREGTLVLRDELRYSANGGLHAIPMLAFTFGREEEANLAWLFLVGLVPLAAYAAGRELLSPRAGILASLLAGLFPYSDAMCLPMMEKPPALFFLLAILAAGLHLRGGGTAWPILAGLFSGLAFQARPTCLPAIALPALLLVRRPPLREGLGLAVAFLAAALPWRLWIWIGAGSPFPISAPIGELVAMGDDGSAVRLHGVFFGNLLAPQTWGPAVLVLVPASLILRGKPNIVRFLLTLLGSSLAIYYAGTLWFGLRLLAAPHHGRYFVTFSLPIGCLIAAWAWERLGQNVRPAAMLVAVALLLQGAALGIVALKRAAVVVPVVAGRVNRVDFLARNIPGYDAIAFLNRTVRNGETAIYLGTYQGLLDVRYRYVDQFRQAKATRESLLALARESKARYVALPSSKAALFSPSDGLRTLFQSDDRMVLELPTVATIPR